MDEEQAFIWNNRWVNCKHQFHATAGETVNSNAVVERLRWLDQRSSLRALLPEGTAAQQEMFASRMPAFPKSAWGIVEALGNDKKEERWRNQRRSHLLELEKQIKAARAKQKAEEDAARELELKRETESSRLFAYSGTGYASPPKSSKDAWRGVTNAADCLSSSQADQLSERKIFRHYTPRTRKLLARTYRKLYDDKEREFVSVTKRIFSSPHKVGSHDPLNISVSSIVSNEPSEATGALGGGEPARGIAEEGLLLWEPPSRSAVAAAAEAAAAATVAALGGGGGSFEESKIGPAPHRKLRHDGKRYPSKWERTIKTKALLRERPWEREEARQSGAKDRHAFMRHTSKATTPNKTTGGATKVGGLGAGAEASGLTDIFSPVKNDNLDESTSRMMSLGDLELSTTQGSPRTQEVAVPEATGVSAAAEEATGGREAAGAVKPKRTTIATKSGRRSQRKRMQQKAKESRATGTSRHPLVAFGRSVKLPTPKYDPTVEAALAAASVISTGKGNGETNRSFAVGKLSFGSSTLKASVTKSTKPKKKVRKTVKKKRTTKEEENAEIKKTLATTTTSKKRRKSRARPKSASYRQSVGGKRRRSSVAGGLLPKDDGFYAPTQGMSLEEMHQLARAEAEYLLQMSGHTVTRTGRNALQKFADIRHDSGAAAMYAETGLHILDGSRGGVGLWYRKMGNQSGKVPSQEEPTPRQKRVQDMKVKAEKVMAHMREESERRQREKEELEKQQNQMAEKEAEDGEQEEEGEKH